MARVTKDPAERRDELLDTALQLCATVGYDALAIDQITREVGVSKGTFYYYFPSKSDMLAALVQRWVDEMVASLAAFETADTGTAAERFQHLLLAATAWKTARLDDATAFIPLLYRPENLELRHRLFEAWHVQMRPLFLPLIEQGIRDRTFQIEDAEATTDLLLSLWLDAPVRSYDRAMAAPDEDAFADIILRGIRALLVVIERMFGVPAGSFALPLPADAVRPLYAVFRQALASEPSSRSSS